MFKYSLLLLLSFSLGSWAAMPQGKDDNTVYRWVDSKGNVHFSQTPPPGKAVDAVKVDAPQPSSTPPTPVSVGQNDEKAESPTQDLVKMRSQLKEACSRAKENLATLTSFDRVRLQEESGEYRVLSEEEKAEQITLYKEQIKEACKS
ncbi:DUF4124 domain-containing protein [Gallaecimonas xiamenensis]|uniref:DUF4124 domain-containing protein n=1 Tax=Gallaecimonas xiamenensis 3-C-1 TaxID=745411 RepID=K2J0D5_9GAMM|nr:DUF4124 domain-containing protein [Gallaecimonas xiamenensis]EKE68252.1 hypothetical protein B3C1_17132 [Gallaecimonas xiamenensis 3-C-1]